MPPQTHIQAYSRVVDTKHEPSESGMLVALVVPPVQIHPPGHGPAGLANPVSLQ